MAKLPLVGLIRFVKFVTTSLKFIVTVKFLGNLTNYYPNYLIFANFVSICCLLLHSDYYSVLNQKAFETYPNFSVSCISEKWKILSSFTHSSMWLSGLLSFCKPVDYHVLYTAFFFLLWVGREFNFWSIFLTASASVVSMFSGSQNHLTSRVLQVYKV